MSEKHLLVPGGFGKVPASLCHHVPDGWMVHAIDDKDAVGLGGVLMNRKDHSDIKRVVKPTKEAIEWIGHHKEKHAKDIKTFLEARRDKAAIGPSTSNWVSARDCAVSGTPSLTAFYANFPVPSYPTGSPNELNAVWPGLLGTPSGGGGLDLLQPVITIGTGWASDGPSVPTQWVSSNWLYRTSMGWWFTQGLNTVTPVGGGLQGFMTKDGSGIWTVGLNLSGSQVGSNLYLNSASNMGTFTTPVVAYETGGFLSACNKYLPSTILFNGMGVEDASGFPTLSWSGSYTISIGCGTQSQTVNSNSNPNSSVTVRPQ